VRLVAQNVQMRLGVDLYATDIGHRGFAPSSEVSHFGNIYLEGSAELGQAYPQCRIVLAKRLF
jgi:hypothetical protein